MGVSTTFAKPGEMSGEKKKSERSRTPQSQRRKLFGGLRGKGREEEDPPQFGKKNELDEMQTEAKLQRGVTERQAFLRKLGFNRKYSLNLLLSLTMLFLILRKQRSFKTNNYEQ